VKDTFIKRFYLLPFNKPIVALRATLCGVDILSDRKLVKNEPDSSIFPALFFDVSCTKIDPLYKELCCAVRDKSRCAGFLR
jgi:hypothetical protein